LPDKFFNQWKRLIFIPRVNEDTSVVYKAQQLLTGVPAESHATLSKLQWVE